MTRHEHKASSNKTKKYTKSCVGAPFNRNHIYSTVRQCHNATVKPLSSSANPVLEQPPSSVTLWPCRNSGNTVPVGQGKLSASPFRTQDALQTAQQQPNMPSLLAAPPFSICDCNAVKTPPSACSRALHSPPAPHPTCLNSAVLRDAMPERGRL